MNHTWNIKNMWNIPAGNKWNMATSGYSNFTDSHFWPEHSQSMSQDMSLSSRTSQQSSQEGSDPKLGNTYHIKPLLFGEFKDKSKGLGILDKFEDDKQTARDKADRDMLAKECCRFRETLYNIQHLVAGIERNTAVCQTVNEKFDDFASTFQNNLTRLQSDISQQFETLLSKLNSQKEMMAELESRMQKSGEAATEVDSHLESLRKSLESLKEEKESEQNTADKVLKLLSTFVSEHSVKHSHEGVMDSAIQTSPELKQPPSDIMQANKLGGSQADESQNLQNNQPEVPYQAPSFTSGRRKPTLRRHKKHKKRPLVLSQRSRHPVTDENMKPIMISRKQHNVSKPLCERQDLSQSSLSPDFPAAASRRVESMAAGCFITPLSCWSQDSSSSLCLLGMDPTLDKLSTESRTGTPVRNQSLWQLFDMDDSAFGL